MIGNDVQQGLQCDLTRMSMSEWFAVQTKPHKEFVVRRVLGRLPGVDAYLPVLQVNPVNPRARKTRAFFPGYLFVCADLATVGMSAILWTPGLVRLLGAEGQPQAIAAHVIEGMRRRIENGQHKAAFGSDAFRHGDRVRIASGPFEGYEAMFDTSLGGKTRARILLEFLGRLTSAEGDVRNLERASRRRP